jgi:hypothetical protein
VQGQTTNSHGCHALGNKLSLLELLSSICRCRSRALLDSAAWLMATSTIMLELLMLHTGDKKSSGVDERQVSDGSSERVSVVGKAQSVWLVVARRRGRSLSSIVPASGVEATYARMHASTPPTYFSPAAAAPQR